VHFSSHKQTFWDPQSPTTPARKSTAGKLRGDNVYDRYQLQLHDKKVPMEERFEAFYATAATASSSSSLDLPAGSVSTVVAGTLTTKAQVFGMLPQDCPTPFLQASDDRLGWFCDFVQRINGMQHGIFMMAGNVTEEEQLSGWTAEAFKSALLKLRKCMPKDAWPHGGCLH